MKMNELYSLCTTVALNSNPYGLTYRNNEIYIVVSVVLICLNIIIIISFYRVSFFGVIHFICVLKASRHLLDHYFLFLLRDEVPSFHPPSATVMEPFILLPQAVWPLGLETVLRGTTGTYIYIIFFPPSSSLQFLSFT